MREFEIVKCTHNYIQLEDETGNVCTLCGNVFDSVTISFTPSFADSQTVAQSTDNFPLINQFASLFNAPVSCINRASLLASQNSFKVNKSALAVVLIYVAMREMDLPVSLSEFASKSGISEYKIIKTFKLISRNLDIPIQDSSCFIQVLSNIFSPKDPAEVTLICKKLGALSYVYWFNEGRSCQSITAACYVLALSSKLKKSPKIQLFQIAAASLNISLKVVKKRYNELLDVMIGLACGIPWLVDFTTNDVFLYTIDILDHAADIMSKTNSTDLGCPPSFERARINSIIVQSKINAANIRIEKMYNFQIDQEELDIMDLYIQDLILSGIPERDILNIKFEANMLKNVTGE